MKKVFLILFLLISNGLMAQENSTKSSNPRLNNPLGITINFGGPSILLSAAIDYFVNSNINIEAGTGFVGFFSGVKYHFNGENDNKNWTPYVGLYLTHIPRITLFNSVPPRTGLYIPVGIQYLSNNGFSFGVEVAGITLKDIGGGTNVWGGLKLGYHF